MPALPVEIRGVLYDLASKSARQVLLVGEASRSDVGIGGGPIIPPGNGGGDGKPPGIWGGGNEPFPTPPIVIPPDQVPPGLQPPTTPPPGTVTAVPGNWPVAPVVAPAYLIVQYPGVGPVYVTPPAGAAPT